MPTLSSTASSTTPIASISPATACDASVPNRRIDHTPDTRQKPTPAGRLKRATSCRNTGRQDLGMTGRLRRNQHLADPVDLEVRLEDPVDLFPQNRIAAFAGWRSAGIFAAGSMLAIRRRGDRQNAADRLDPV